VHFTKFYQDDVIKEGEMGGACSNHGRGDEVLIKFNRKTEKKRLPCIPRRRWKDDTKMDL